MDYNTRYYCPINTVRQSLRSDVGYNSNCTDKTLPPGGSMEKQTSDSSTSFAVGSCIQDVLLGHQDLFYKCNMRKTCVVITHRNLIIHNVTVLQSTEWI